MKKMLAIAKKMSLATLKTKIVIIDVRLITLTLRVVALSPDRQELRSRCADGIAIAHCRCDAIADACNCMHVCHCQYYDIAIDDADAMPSTSTSMSVFRVRGQRCSVFDDGGGPAGRWPMATGLAGHWPTLPTTL